MPIYAISDLHLSFANPKPMDIFGRIWEGHEERIARNWGEIVGKDDTVLVAGDHSWALRLEDAIPDLDYIAQRPGKKILIRGNHDYWWRRESTTRIQKQLPESITLMQGHAVVIDGIGITGTRGWRIETCEQGDKGEVTDEPGGAKVMQRELIYLERGLKEIPADVSKKIVMLHYPPFTTDLEPTGFVDLLKKYNVHTLVYGHIHSGSYLEGDIDGIKYRLVSVDHTKFKPVQIA